MGCNSSKATTNDVIESKPKADTLTCEFIDPLEDIKRHKKAPAPEPEPEPPAAPTVCDTYHFDEDAPTCLDCGEGWLSRTASTGKPGVVYYYSAAGASQWACPPGAPKTKAEATCACGMLRSAHRACCAWKPTGTVPQTCSCGFTKEEHSPCMEYRVNMQAENFGDCKCGFAKDMHVKEAFAGGAKKKREERNSKDLRDEMNHKTYADCAVYRVNLASGNFGECMCGRPKAEHSPEALAKNAAAGQTAGTTRRNSGEVRQGFVQKAKVTCARYEPDMTAGEFGVCRCGAKRAEHTDAALAADTGKHAAKQQDAGDVRAGFVQRALADCARFELNMDPSAPFGTCTCGRPRAEHSEAALAADKAPKCVMVRKHSSEVRREMEAKQEAIGTAVEATGAKTGVAFGLGNTVRTAAEEQAAVDRAINARAGGAEKAAALNEFNEMMKDVGAPAAAAS